MILYLVRHPETLRSKNNKITGWERTNYSKRGREQFKKMLKFFEGYKGMIYSSDLPRALRLAKKISEKNKLRLVVSRLLRERNFKETKPLNKFETQEQFKNRVRRFVKKYDIKTGIIVSHSGTIRELIKYFLDKKRGVKEESISGNTIFRIESNKKHKKLRKIKI